MWEDNKNEIRRERVCERDEKKSVTEEIKKKSLQKKDGETKDNQQAFEVNCHLKTIFLLSRLIKHFVMTQAHQQGFLYLGGGGYSVHTIPNAAIQQMVHWIEEAESARV